MKSYPAPLYAALFVKGSRQTYTFEAKHWYWNDQDPRADQEGNVVEESTGSITCTVIEVHELPSAIASRLDCEYPSAVHVVGDDGPNGIYVATAEGLWRVPEMPRVAPTATADRLFASSPAAGVTEEPDRQNPGWGMRVSVSQDGRGGWCRRLDWTTAHPGVAEICVGHGIVLSGSFESDGGESRSFWYQLAKT